MSDSMQTHGSSHRNWLKTMVTLALAVGGSLVVPILSFGAFEHPLALSADSFYGPFLVIGPLAFISLVVLMFSTQTGPYSGWMFLLSVIGGMAWWASSHSSAKAELLAVVVLYLVGVTVVIEVVLRGLKQHAITCVLVMLTVVSYGVVMARMQVWVG